MGISAIVELQLILSLHMVKQPALPVHDQLILSIRGNTLIVVILPDQIDLVDRRFLNGVSMSRKGVQNVLIIRRILYSDPEAVFFRRISDIFIKKRKGRRQT